ncbi:hypothetical protein AMS68_001456 [Peltaster fructicola]|uniref:Uncharacterized protein n=1 Tax=Peltaster fructicola TaxID=286661 RepID=A0A6H0XMU2_9PEZI|nr:hypothetical protein AMS68_001456 [Peltaster fructicola]
MADPPPPPPPPHGQNPRPPGGLPDGNYDIFIIPPHSSGSGFLYLPSLTPHRNSFIAGAAAALAGVGVVVLVTPFLQAFFASIMVGNPTSVLILVIGVGVLAWLIGKSSVEFTSTSSGKSSGTGSSGPGQDRQNHGAQQNQQNHGAQQQQQQGQAPPPNPGFDWNSANHNHAPPPPPPPPQPEPQPQPNTNSTQSGWDKAKEETKKREEARKRTEELERRRAEAAKAREEAERAAKAKAEKEKWEQARAREKEQREREARERLAKEKAASMPDKETREKSIRERMERLRKEREERERQKAASSPSATGRSSPKKEYVRPTAKSAVGTEDQYSYRPYDTPPKPKTPYHASSASSISGLSESSYAASQTTAQTTPPASMRGPYSTQDPDKILIRAVYLFNDSFPGKPIAQLVVGQGSVSDGLILNIRTAGLFIDDDVRKVPQREWDVKAWTLKLVEDGALKGAVGGQGLHVLRASVRNAENSKYCFVLDETEGWKVAIGLQRLRKGTQVRSLGMSGMKENEVRGLLGALGWL